MPYEFAYFVFKPSIESFMHRQNCTYLFIPLHPMVLTRTEKPFWILISQYIYIYIYIYMHAYDKHMS